MYKGNEMEMTVSSYIVLNYQFCREQMCFYIIVSGCFLVKYTIKKKKITLHTHIDIFDACTHTHTLQRVCYKNSTCLVFGHSHLHFTTHLKAEITEKATGRRDNLESTSLIGHKQIRLE